MLTLTPVKLHQTHTLHRRGSHEVAFCLNRSIDWSRHFYFSFGYCLASSLDTNTQVGSRPEHG